MGEHGTWFDYLNRFSWWRSLNADAEHALGRKWRAVVFQDTHFTLVHVLVTLLVIGFVVWGALSFKRGLASADGGMVPPRKMNLRNFFEMTAEGVYGLVEGAMGEKNAKRFFPFIGTLWIFILFGNLIGLIPGFITPNDTIKTNLALAGLVFVLTHYYGIKEHGPINYFKHFAGPVPALAPLIFPIELISHVARPLSLTFRLLGNMVADHKVVFTFTTLLPLFVPIPFYLLGMLVCFVQALVFCMLTMVYLGMAIEHEEH
jgi:F-type H+-transporting ATPase subunit a